MYRGGRGYLARKTRRNRNTGIRYAEKWWKRNGYEFEHIGSSDTGEEYLVWKTGSVRTRVAIDRGGDCAGQMKAFQVMYEVKDAIEHIPMPDDRRDYHEETDA